MSKAESSHFEYSVETENAWNKSKDTKLLRKSITIHSLTDLTLKHSKDMVDLSDIKFDIFKQCEIVGREQLLPVMTLTAMYNMGLKPLIN